MLMITPLAQGEIFCGKLMWMPKLIQNLQSWWYKNNQMQANATKFHYKHTSKDTDTDFQCEGINIKSEDMVKMFGINIDKKTLKFTSHATEVIRKCAYQLNALKRISKILNTKTKMHIYHAFIEANLNYC